MIEVPKIAYIFSNYYGHANMFYNEWPNILRSYKFNTCAFSLVGLNHRINVSANTFYFEGAQNVAMRSLTFAMQNPRLAWQWAVMEHRLQQRSIVRRWAEYGGLITYNPDLIHLVNSTTFLKLRTFEIPTPYHLVSSFHGYDLVTRPYKDVYWKNALKELFTQADALHFVSEWLKTRAIELGADEAKCRVIYAGIDSDYFKPSRQKSSSAKISIVSTGRLVKLKGFDFAVRAIAALVNLYPEIEYRIIGSGEEFDDLKRLIQSLKLEKNVFLLGFKSKSEVRDSLQQADIYLQPSLTESLCAAVLEAASMGLPIIASRVGGIPEIVQDGVNGLLTLPADVESIIEGLKFLINNPIKASQFGTEARKTVLDKFSIEIQSQNLNNLYRLLLNKSTQRS